MKARPLIRVVKKLKKIKKLNMSTKNLYTRGTNSRCQKRFERIKTMAANEHHALQANAAEAQILHRLSTAANSTNRTYASHVKKFKSWVDEKPDDTRETFNIPYPGPPRKYISRLSVESFFLEVQKPKCVTSGTMDKVVCALNQLAIREESADIGPDIREGFAGDVVKSVLAYVSKKKEDALKLHSKTSDPHSKNPLNIISQEDISKVMATRLQNGQKWSDLVTVWAITTVMLLRFDSACVLTLNKLYLYEDRPPDGLHTPQL